MFESPIVYQMRPAALSPTPENLQILFVQLTNTAKTKQDFTAAVAQWLERSPREREVVGSIPDPVIPKTL